jgi:hypothetical protein
LMFWRGWGSSASSWFEQGVPTLLGFVLCNAKVVSSSQP